MNTFHVFGLLFLIALAGCSKGHLKRFEVQGVVVSLEIDSNRLIINHEEIPGYMPSMVMPFLVKGSVSDLGLKSGDVIRFVYMVDDRDSWIESIEIIGTSETSSDLLSAVDALDDRGLLKVGEFMNDYGFVRDGKSVVKLSDFRGERVAISFVFSRCPVPEYCPRMMMNFSEVVASLEGGEQFSSDWRLLTVSFDPEYDSPEVLEAYGDLFGQSSDNWSMYTCEDEETLSSIARDVGLKFGKSNGTYLHNLRTVVLDEEGRLLKIFTDESWRPDELVVLLGE